MEISAIRTTGLGDATYLLAHEGVGVVVDPQRDVDRFERAVSDAGVELMYVLETHLHNDYVSGGRELARRSGAALVLPAGSGAAFEHMPAFHEELLQTDVLSLRPLHTPGHTPEHVSYAVVLDGEVVAVFSGGSLLVGSAGRPDLLGLERAEQLARLQYGSVNRLARLPDDAGLYPTHGEGSFCSISAAGRETSTIGLEKRTNPVLAHPDVESFVTAQLAGLQPFPSYYAHMGPINLMGPTPLPRTTLPEIDPNAIPQGAALVDIRPRGLYAAGHIPGAFGLEESDRVGVWAGWLLPFDSPVVLVADRNQDVDEVARQFWRIGFDDVRGVVFDIGSFEGELRSFRVATAEELYDALADGDPPQVLDVRSPGDWEVGHIEGSMHRYTPDLREGMPDAFDPSRDLWVVCATGFRALAATAMIEAAGVEPVVVTSGGVARVLELAAA